LRSIVEKTKKIVVVKKKLVEARGIFVVAFGGNKLHVPCENLFRKEGIRWKIKTLPQNETICGVFSENEVSCFVQNQLKWFG
jgi:hypothetical protein